MRFALCRLVPVLALAVPTLAHAAADPDRAQAGSLFVAPADGKAELRETADPTSRVIGTATPGARLVYRRVAIDLQNKPSWYRVEPPSGAPGWLAAAETTEKRPTAPPPAKPVKVLDSGLASGEISASPTAAARGLDARARKYGQQQDLAKSADQFVTLEDFVEKLYLDPHAPDGTYPEEGAALKPRAATRRAKALQFKRGLK